MKLEPMPPGEIYNVVDHCYKSGYYSLIIILTDGTTFCTTIPGKAWGGGYPGLIPVSKQCFSLPNHLEVEHDQVDKEHSIYIPFNQIAGISTLQYSQEQIKTLGLPISSTYHVGSAYERLFEDFLPKAQRHLFKVERHHPMYRLTIHQPFKWGKISFGGDTPLYCDWDFLSKTSGGLNNLGVGFVVSFSAGWKNSLWRSFKKKVEQTRTELDHVVSKREVTVSGFVQFVKFDKSTQLKSETEGLLEMESERWCSAIISSLKVKHISQLKKVSWTLAYFKEPAFMFPKDLWERFSQEIRVYGEVIPVAVKTEFGEVGCFIKARAAAYIK